VEHFRRRKRTGISSEKDWEAYLKKWEGVFYNPQKNNSGGWIYQSYNDQYRTWQHFPASERARIGLNRSCSLIRQIADAMKNQVKQYVLRKK
jgi:hypothetical protein